MENSIGTATFLTRPAGLAYEVVAGTEVIGTVRKGIDCWKGYRDGVRVSGRSGRSTLRGAALDVWTSWQSDQAVAAAADRARIRAAYDAVYGDGQTYEEHGADVDERHFCESPACTATPSCAGFRYTLGDLLAVGPQEA